MALARCLVKRPAILVLDEPLAIFGDVEGRVILDRVRKRCAGMTVIAALRDKEVAQTFDHVLAFAGGRLRQAAPDTDLDSTAGGSPKELEQAEIEALRAVPMFATVDSTRLKLIAFTSDRVSFTAGQLIFRQGDPSDTAYVLLDGSAEVFLETASRRLHLATVGAHSTIGEMGVLSGAPRSATVVAQSKVNAIELSKDVVLGLIGEFPQIALAMLRDQIRRTLLVDDRLARASEISPTVASTELTEEKADEHGA